MPSSKSVYLKCVPNRGGVPMAFLVYLLPVSCFLFVNNLVSVIEKVHKDDKNTGFNTIGSTLGLLLITGAIIATQS